MNTRQLQLLLHPFFILSLACLVLNDSYWKYAYHNSLTGKLSDFTGLFVITVFLFALFPKRRSITCLSLVLFFIWWKSPFSQPVIDWLNSLFSISFARTVDYSDFLALPVVLAPYLIKRTGYQFTLIRKVSVYLFLLFVLLRFALHQ